MTGEAGFRSLIEGLLAAETPTAPLLPPSHPFEKISLRCDDLKARALLSPDDGLGIFLRELGFDPNHPERLRHALFDHARRHACVQVEELERDVRFIFRGAIHGPKGSADMDSVWLVEKYGIPPTAQLEALALHSQSAKE